MKARSTVFTSLARPDTAMGLPPRLFLALVLAAFVVGILCSVAGLSSLMMPALVATAAGGWLLAFRAARADHHVDSVWLASAAFWGVRRHRWLLAGRQGPASHRRRPRRRMLTAPSRLPSGETARAASAGSPEARR